MIKYLLLRIVLTLALAVGPNGFIRGLCGEPAGPPFDSGKLSASVTGYGISTWKTQSAAASAKSPAGVTFSFSGKNAGRLMGIDAGMEYSLDGGWSYRKAQTADQKLTAEQLSEINEFWDIRVRASSSGKPSVVDITGGPGESFLLCDDLNNIAAGLDNSMESSYDKRLWSICGQKIPNAGGNISLYVRKAASGTTLPGRITRLVFTAQANKFGSPVDVSPLAAGVDCRSVSLGGSLYAMVSRSSETALYQYSPTDYRWIRKNGIEYRSGYRLAAAGGRIYVMGGENGGGFLASVKVYDPSSGSWDEAAGMSEARRDFGTVVIGNTIYVFGGRNEKGVLDSVEAYDIASGKWSAKTRMPSAQCCFSAASLDGNAYMIVSHCERKHIYTNERDVYIYRPGSNSWQVKHYHGLYPVTGYGLVGWNGRLIMLGGRTIEPMPCMTNAVEVFNPGADTWTASTGMIAPRADFDAVLLEGRVFMTGGNGGSVSFTAEAFGIQ